MVWLWAVASSIAVAAVAILYQQNIGRRNSNNTINNSISSSSSSSSSSGFSNAVYVIGDTHGDVDCARYWVNRTGLVIRSSSNNNINDNTDDDGLLTWTDPTSSLVFLGDYLDKGPASRWTVEFVKSLTDQFPDRVHALLGNHELEALRDRTDKVFGDSSSNPQGTRVGYFQLGYASVHPAEYLNFLEPSDRDEDLDALVVEALYNASIEAYGQGLYRSTYMIPDETAKGSILRLIPETDLRTLVGARLQLYQKRYLDAWRTGTVLGTWLEQRPVVAVVGDTLFVHGGVRPEVGQRLRTVDTDAVRWINQQWFDHAQEDKLQQFLTQTTAGQMVYSLVTYRGNHQDGACAFLPNVLPDQVKRLAVGHTPGASVRLRCEDDTFLALDSSLSRWFRNSGNEYCYGDKTQVSSNGKFQCRKKSEQCQGQIVRILSDGKVEVMV